MFGFPLPPGQKQFTSYHCSQGWMTAITALYCTATGNDAFDKQVGLLLSSPLPTLVSHSSRHKHEHVAREKKKLEACVWCEVLGS